MARLCVTGPGNQEAGICLGVNFARAPDRLKSTRDGSFAKVAVVRIFAPVSQDVIPGIPPL